MIAEANAVAEHDSVIPAAHGSTDQMAEARTYVRAPSLVARQLLWLRLWRNALLVPLHPEVKASPRTGTADREVSR